MTRNFVRPDFPDLIFTADLGHPKCSATKVTSSALALPSTGGDFSRANQVQNLAHTKLVS
jgi:hypothetical protein